MGDRSGLRDIETSIEIATAVGALGTLARVYNNLCASYQVLGELDSAYDARLAGARIAEQIGSASEIRWFEGTLSDNHYRRGEWETSMRLAERFLGSVEAGSPHYSAWQVHAIRGEMRLAKGDDAEAVADIDVALDAASTVEEIYPVCFARAAAAHVFAVAGEHDRALPPARALLEVLRAGGTLGFAAINLPFLASASLRIGLADELRDALRGQSATRWVETARTYAARDFVAVAEMLREIGSRPDEAEARRWAGEQLLAEGRRDEAEAQLQQALAFYRSVGATRYVRECEALLAGRPRRGRSRTRRARGA